MYLKKLINLTFLLLCLSISPLTFSQDMSTVTCQIHEMVMLNQILPFRKQGIMGVGEAERQFNDEEDVRTRVFLKKFVREMYADPVMGEKVLRSGGFRNACIKINRGY
jgi:hypothetical protein